MTWDDLEERRLHCPVVHAMFEYIRRGMSREDALIRAVLWLSEDREGQIRERTRLMSGVTSPNAFRRMSR